MQTPKTYFQDRSKKPRPKFLRKKKKNRLVRNLTERTIKKSFPKQRNISIVPKTKKNQKKLPLTAHFEVQAISLKKQRKRNVKNVPKAKIEETTPAYCPFRSYSME